MPHLPDEPEEVIDVAEAVPEPEAEQEAVSDATPAVVTTRFGSVQQRSTDTDRILRRIRNHLTDGLLRIKREREETREDKTATQLLANPMNRPRDVAFLMENRLIKKDGALFSLESSFESVRQDVDTLQRTINDATRGEQK